MIQVLDEQGMDAEQRMKVREARDDLKKRREQKTEEIQNGKAFFARLDDAKIAELKERVKLRLAENEMRPKIETDTVNLHRINTQFEKAFPEFQNKLLDAEMQRLDSVSKMIEMHVMHGYLIDPNQGGKPQELRRRLQSPDHGGNRKLQEELRAQMKYPSIDKIFGKCFRPPSLFN